MIPFQFHFSFSSQKIYINVTMKDEQCYLIWDLFKNQSTSQTEKATTGFPINFGQINN